MSTSSCMGLLGVSKKTACVGTDSASRHWSRSGPSTNTVSTPQRGRISSRMTKHEPNSPREEHHPVALAQQGCECDEDGRHAGGRGEAGLGALELAQPLARTWSRSGCRSGSR